MKMQWKIGNVEIPNPIVLAPKAGVTALAFRRLCKEQGAVLICMEMVSATAYTQCCLIQGTPSTSSCGFLFPSM